jgi:hypothetical protein
MANAATVTADHTLTRHHSMTGSYAYLGVRPINSSASAGSGYQAVSSLNAGYMYTVNPELLFRLTGGLVRGSESAYTAGAAVEKQIGNVTVIAGYRRYLSFFEGLAPGGAAAGESVVFANGVMPSSLFQAALLRVRGQLTRRVGLEFYGERGQSTLGARGIRSLIAQSRLDYKLNDRYTVFGRAEFYGQNISQFTDGPLSRRRYIGGLEIVLSRPPEATDAQRKHGKLPADSADPQADQPPAPPTPEEK